MLKDHGYFLILLSYCGIERAEEITQARHDQDLMQYFDQVKFTWKKTGPQGKAVYCRDNHIRFLIDDSPDIVDTLTTSTPGGMSIQQGTGISGKLLTSS